MKSGSYRQEKKKAWTEYWELLNKMRLLKTEFQVYTATGHSKLATAAMLCRGSPQRGAGFSAEKPLHRTETVLDSRTKANIFISQLLLWQEIKYIHRSSFLENVNYLGSYKPNTEEKTQQFIFSDPSKSPHPPSTHPRRCPALPSWAATGSSMSGFCGEEWK